MVPPPFQTTSERPSPSIKQFRAIHLAISHVMAQVRRSLGQRLTPAHRSFQREFNPAFQKSNEVANSRYLKVEGLSRTALPSDLRRLCVKSRVENIESTSLNYRRFSPTQEGFIVLNNPGHANPALKALRENVVGGFRVTTTSVPSLNDNTPIRSRGRRGRDEAMERGIITGDGPNAGITDRGKSVVIYGLPGKMTAESLRSYLKTFKFGSEDGTQSIMKIPVPEGKLSLTSKHLVRMASQAEAHRVVRRFHMTFFQQDIWGYKYQMKAHVIY